MKKKSISFLGIIPARSGSKGIRGKNVRLLLGKPLMAYSIKAAAKSALLDDCIVSTENSDYAALARQWGAKVPFLRPKELARDTTPTLPVLLDALHRYEAMTGKYFSHVVLLQPTSPLRLARDIDAAIQLFKRNPKADHLVSVQSAQDLHPKKVYTLRGGKVEAFVRGDKAFRRQAAGDIYMRNGAVYIIRRDLLEKGIIFGHKPLLYVMPRLRSVDIDSLADFKMAELILNAKAHVKD